MMALVARVARTLVDLPAIAKVFGEGGLSWEQLVPLCRLATADTDTRWATEGPGYAPAELWRLARRANPPTAKEAMTAHEARGVSCRADRKVAGLDVLTLRLPEAEMATVVARVNDLADTDFEASRHTGDRQGQRVRERAAPVDPATACVWSDAGGVGGHAHRLPVRAPSRSRRRTNCWNRRAAVNEMTKRITAIALP